MIKSLNALYSGGTYARPVRRVTDLGGLPLAQRQALYHILRRVREFGPPPSHISTAGALEALRIACSPYGGESVGVGDVIPMKLDFLSIPGVSGQGNDIKSHLSGPAGEYLKYPSELMLQHADNWGTAADEVRQIRTYDDPQLRQRDFYKRFLEKLKKAGILSFSKVAAGRVGAFVVSKKPKEIDGAMRERQRLILDCRKVNALFRAPPVTELGSLSAVGDLYIPSQHSMYVSGGDIRDCFYACRLPDELLSYFCFSFDISVGEVAELYDGGLPSGLEGLPNDAMVGPGLNVLPMGFSWSFFLVQALYVQACGDPVKGVGEHLVLDARPPPTLSSSSTLSMPYCDNTHILSLSADRSQEGMDAVKGKLEDWGFEVHEEISATTLFPTLGGVIDGQAGLVRATAERSWRLRRVCNHIVNNSVSSKLVQRVLGHSMVVLALNRSGMGVFRSAYDFAAKDFKRKELWMSAKREFEIFSGLLPMLVSDLRLPWSQVVTVTDASPEGFGICQKEFDEAAVEHVGRWQERWRYKRTPIDEWAPRRRALGDPLIDPVTAARNPEAFEQSDCYMPNEDFQEVPVSMLDPQGYQVILSGRWTPKHEHITLKEDRTLVLAVRRLARNSNSQGKRHLVLVDNLALAFAAGKGRCSNHAMLRENQKIGALLLACNIVLRVRWVPSEYNVSDGPSRGASTPGHFNAGGKQETKASRQWSRESAAESRAKHSPITEWEGQQQHRNRKSDEEESPCRTEECGGEFLSGGSSPWEQSPVRTALPAGEEKHQQRTRESIHALPQEVQGLLQGQRFAVAASVKGRLGPGRFLRHPLPGRSWGERWRKDARSSGVPVAPRQGHSTSQPKSPSRVAKRGRTKKSAPSRQDGGFRHSHADAESSATWHGPAGAPVVRCLSTTRGGADAQSQESGAPSPWEWIAVSTLRRGGSGRGRLRAGQDGGVQQLAAAGPPKDAKVAGESAGETEKGQKGERPSFQRGGGKVPKGVRVGRRLAGIARASHLPTSAWRSSRRPVDEDKGVCGSQRPWKVENRLIGAEIRQSGQGSDVVEQNATLGIGLLSKSRGLDGGSVERIKEPAQPVSPLWQDWREAPAGSCLEIFAGCGRLTVALRRAGVSAFCLDICLNPNDDVLQPEVEAQLVELLQQQRFSFVWLGMPCTSFSIARKNDGIGPPPLRSNSRPMGLPGLKPHDRRKLHEGNRLLYFTCRIMYLCELLRVPYVLENPQSSRCWQTPILKSCITGGRAKLVELHFCQFGERWRKPTSLLCYGLDLKQLGRCCKGTFTSCSVNGKRHIPLHGIAADGRFMTLIAQPYPFQLVKEIADAVSKQLFSRAQGG